MICGGALRRHKYYSYNDFSIYKLILYNVRKRLSNVFTTERTWILAVSLLLSDFLNVRYGKRANDERGPVEPMDERGVIDVQEAVNLNLTQFHMDGV